jgi:putative chitinase
MFGPSFDTPTVRAGLPSLNTEMRAASITTPKRIAAFLATVKNESGFRYDAVWAGSDAYRGRGFIQLTSSANYAGASAGLNHDFLGTPSDAALLRWSAPLARWYWTVARDINPLADQLNMGAVNDAIGYAPNAAEDAERCNDFKSALGYLLGEVPGSVKC